MDYHKPIATKDEHGGWNGPYPVVKNEPESGSVICKHGNREIRVSYPDARLTLFIECILTMEYGLDNDAMDVLLEYISRLSAGKTPVTFGYAGAQGNLKITAISKQAPKIFLALQYVIRNLFRINDVVAVRLGKSVTRFSKVDNAGRYAVGQNASDHPYNPNLWSRFDWTFGAAGLFYCQIAYDAVDEATALAVDGDTLFAAW